MLREIYRFELRYQLTQPLFAIALALFCLLTFGAVTTDGVTIGGAIGAVHRNSPFVIMQILLVMSVLGAFLTTAFVAGASHRDVEFRTEALFFSTPMRVRDYLLGRFAGSITAAFLVFAGVGLSIVIGSFMPWLEAERLGPFALAPYLYALFVLVLPNLLFTGAMFFSVAALTRSLMYTYASLVLFFVGYLTAAAMLSDLDNERLGILLDPFGFAAFGIATKYWTVAEKNANVLGLAGPLLLNRLLWLGVAALCLILTLARFRVESGAGKRKNKKSAPVEESESVVAGAVPRAAVTDFSPAVHRTQFRHQVRQEVGGVVRSLPFVILLVLGVLNLIGTTSSLDELFGTPVYPVTHLILQAIQGAFLLFVVLVMTLYAGELTFRERGLKLADVFDALPVPSWVYWGAKLAALVVVVGSLLAVALATGVGIQLSRGYHHLELGLYLKGLFLEIGVPFLLLAVLALFFQSVCNHKFVGFLAMVLYFVSNPILNALGYQHNLYRYVGAPDSPYSDMNGYGHFVAPLFWFYLYWAFFAVILLVVTHLFWVRGTGGGLKLRAALARQRLTPKVRAILAAACVLFAATGAFCFYNTNILNPYLSDRARMDRQAEFEKAYKKYEGLPQPRVTDVSADVDIFPKERRVAIRGRYALLNKTDAPIDRIHVSLNPRLKATEIRIPGAHLEASDERLGYSIYALESPLAPGAATELTFDLAWLNPGFVNNGSNTRVVANGTFFDSGDTFPHLGYVRDFELTEPNERRRRGLPPVQRMPKIDDEAARRNNYISAESDWLRFATTVSTDPDQIALAPGYLEKEWEKDGRRYFKYTMDAPILGFWAYLSARYEVKRDHWNDVAIEVYYHPDHAYNVDRMINAVKKSLDYFTREFGPYQHRQVRILEFPRYDRFAQSFPNTIPFSESIGFIARLDDENSIDYVFYVTAHEVAHQWWAHQVIGGNVQGATVTSETLAQYSALMVMEKEYGPEKMRKFLKYELDRYLRGRGGERIEELPLLLVENQPYIHYNKGSLVMYELRDQIGETALNAALARYVSDVKFQEPPYTTSKELLSYLEAAVPEDRRGLLDDLFRNITLYENRVSAAHAKRNADGKYVVQVEIESTKFRADGAGVETEIPVSDWVDVAVFGKPETGGPPEGKILAREKKKLDARTTALNFVVDEEPKKAGVNPFHKLVDRNPDNNLSAVSME